MKPTHLSTHNHNKIPNKEIILADKIGQGGYGKVYRGNWFDKSVAVKQ